MILDWHGAMPRSVTELTSRYDRPGHGRCHPPQRHTYRPRAVRQERQSATGRRIEKWANTDPIFQPTLRGTFLAPVTYASTSLTRCLL